MLQRAGLTILIYRMRKIESVIFDWGGVLIDDPAGPMIKYCAAALGTSEDNYLRASRIFHTDFQKGLITENSFWSGVCKELNLPQPKASSLWTEVFEEAYHPKPAMFALVRSLRDWGIKIALLSNTEEPAMRYFHQQNYNMFDVTVFSCAKQTVKPESRIYKLTLAALNSLPARTVLIDDNSEYIAGAKQLRLETILFHNIEQVRAELSTLTGL